AVVGWYAAAYRIVTIPAFVPAIVMTVVFPALSASSSDAAAFGRLGRRALHGVVVVSVPMALGIMVVADGLIRALGYPASFANSVLPMQILALHIPLAAIDTLIGTVLNASDRQRQWAMTGVAAAVLNPALNMIAIPLTQSALGNGAIGAAVITLATETFMLVAGLRLLPRGIIDTTTTARLARGVAAALVMAAMVWPLRDLPLFVPIGAGVLAYAASCLVLGAVSLGELVDAWHHIVRRGHAAASAPAA
ncbi:MAG: polysaccharide biosynthesis C-terminal domain-containing protein, partial [Candidatus Limnocylindria bacterium]